MVHSKPPNPKNISRSFGRVWQYLAKGCRWNAEADGRPRGGKATPAICHGHNKDFRPDLRAAALHPHRLGRRGGAHRLPGGRRNTPDDLTHIPTWDELRALVGKADFLYVADGKLCSKEAMGHIAARGGRFVTVVPHGRREDTWFRD